MVGSLPFQSSIVRVTGWLVSYARVVTTDILSFLPTRLVEHLSAGRKVVRIEKLPSGEGLCAVLPDGQTMLGIEDFQSAQRVVGVAKSSLVALRVPDTSIISTTLRVPGRAVAKLDEVVKTHISVWTPFAADEIYFKARVISRASLDGASDSTGAIELRCVPKAALDAWHEALAETGISADEIWFGPDGSFAIPLDSPKRARLRRSRRAAWALAGLAGVQIVLFVGLFRSAQDDRINELATRLDQVRAAIHQRALWTQKAEVASRTLAAIRARASGAESATRSLSLLGHVLPPGATYREIRLAHGAEGSLTIASRDKIDPVAIVAATGLLTVTEVNELGGGQENGHVYTVAFRPASVSGASN